VYQIELEEFGQMMRYGGLFEVEELGEFPHTVLTVCQVIPAT
jgi:hypothetical protein